MVLEMEALLIKKKNKSISPTSISASDYLIM